MTFTYGSVCSGIEAASLAWEPLGWKPVFFSEIDKFCRAVLAHHYPDVPNHGDMTKFKDWPDHAIDLLVGGTPCQSFSVAGLRAGMDDPRGNLALTYLAIAAKYRPRWLAWENVPGVLSSHKGRDFGSIIGGMVELGYGVAYRVLDAQFCRSLSLAGAVPQRRKRVLVIGYLGDWRRAAAVLFDGASLRGDHPPRREAGQVVALALDASSARRRGSGQNANQLVAAAPVANPLTARMAKGVNTTMDEGPTMIAVAPTLTGTPYGDNESREGLLIPAVAPTLNAGGNSTGGARQPGMSADTAEGLIPIPFDTTQITNPNNRSNPQPGDPMHPLAAQGHPPAIAFKASHYTRGKDGAPSDVAFPLSADADKGDQDTLIAFPERLSGTAVAAAVDVSPSLGALNPMAVKIGWRVRRLTPLECCRLQGFPDDYFDGVRYRGKRPADGPIYKALGNSMATNVMEVIGERIAMVDAL